MDTDHTSYILRGDPSVIENAQQYNAAITIITVQELFNGWVSRANDPKQAVGEACTQRNRLIEIYAKLSTTVGYLKTLEILDFTLDADSCLKELLKNYPTLRKNRLQKDLRIAAIALSLGATLATAQSKRFWTSARISDCRLVTEIASDKDMTERASEKYHSHL